MSEKSRNWSKINDDGGLTSLAIVYHGGGGSQRRKN